jgi:hypothetical protein
MVMIKIKNFCLLLGLIAFISCEEKAVDPEILGSKINFSNLQVGQKSQYISRKTAKWTNTNDADFQWGTDTLTVEIVSQDQNGFRVKESVVPDLTMGPLGNRTFYYLKVVGDSLFVSKDATDVSNSRLFRSVNTRFFIRDFASPNMTLAQWTTTTPPNLVDDYTGFTTNFKYLNATFGRVNVDVRRRPMQWDGEGKFFIYSPMEGILVSAINGSFNPAGTAWYRLN